MSGFPSKSSSSGGAGSAPKGYIPGLGRGASGFTTRSDIGNMLGSVPTTANAAVAAAARNTSNNAIGPSRSAAGIGPVLMPPPAPPSAASSGGSRAAEARAAKIAAMQFQRQQQQPRAQRQSLFGQEPKGYVAGVGRGAGVMGASSASSGEDRLGRGDDGGGKDANNNNNNNNAPYSDRENNNNANAVVSGQFDEEDEEAEQIWNAIDERMKQTRHKKNKKRKLGDDDNNNDDGTNNNSRARIGAQFRELKEQLANVSEEEWLNIPNVGDFSSTVKKYKKDSNNNNDDVFTPLTDSLLEQQSRYNQQSEKTSALQTDQSSATSLASMRGLGAARGTVLGMSLDRMSDSVSGQTVVDPKGYLTSMTTLNGGGGIGADGNIIPQNIPIGDLQKARLLLKSVRDTNPRHGPAWIASARVEEAAGKILQARKLLVQYALNETTQLCTDQEDVWLEAARIHPSNVAKSILATAVRYLPHSVQIFLKAASLEHALSAKKAVLRKALEANPTSQTLWKTAIDLEEDSQSAKWLLAVAVEQVQPVSHRVEFYLALAKLETYTAAKQVLNKARKVLPGERRIWMAASQLEESQGHYDIIPKLISRAFTSLHKAAGALGGNKEDPSSTSSSSSGTIIITRDQWLQEAAMSEQAGAPHTAAAIVHECIGMGVDVEDEIRTWSDDAKAQLVDGGSSGGTTTKTKNVAVARAILAHALQKYPTKKSLWIQAVELERQEFEKYYNDAIKNKNKKKEEKMENDDGEDRNGNEELMERSSKALDEILQAASERLPHVQWFWLVRAKHQWNVLQNVEAARSTLTRAFDANPNSEQIWLAASKLEMETGEYERARVLLTRARERASSSRVYMKSALLERDYLHQPKHALSLIDDGIDEYSKYAKLYMMGGTIWMCNFFVDVAMMSNTDNAARKLSSSLLSLLPKSSSSQQQRQQHQSVDVLPQLYLDKARKYFQKGLNECPDNITLWRLASQLEEQAYTLYVVYDEQQQQRQRQQNGENDNDDKPRKTASTIQEYYDNSISLLQLSTSASFLSTATSTITTTTPKFMQNLMLLSSHHYHNHHPLTTEQRKTKAQGLTKARSILELGRLKNPKTPELWLEAIRLERRAVATASALSTSSSSSSSSSSSLADSLMARALQECPTSDILWTEAVMIASRTESKSKSTLAVQRCPESPLVIAAVASLFVKDATGNGLNSTNNNTAGTAGRKKKLEKARKWYERALVLDSDIGDIWAKYYALELQHGTITQQESIKSRCVQAQPRHGEQWQSIMKLNQNNLITMMDKLRVRKQEEGQKQQNNNNNKNKRNDTTAPMDATTCDSPNENDEGQAPNRTEHKKLTIGEGLELVVSTYYLV